MLMAGADKIGRGSPNSSLGAPDISLKDPLDLLASYVELVREDLGRGDIERVLNYLRTICVIGAQIEQQLRLGIAVGKAPVASAPPVVQDVGHTPQGGLGRPRSAESSRLSETIVSILSETSGPVALKDLIEALETKSVRLPGQGKPANLIAHMKRMPGVTRVSRGMYALASGELAS
jgi:hypothetical protein